MIKNDVDVEKIIIKYADGTEKEISQGAVVYMNDISEDEVNMVVEFSEFKNKDLINFIYGVTEMGVKMGLFNREE